MGGNGELCTNMYWGPGLSLTTESTSQLKNNSYCLLLLRYFDTKIKLAETAYISADE